jgi:hypothetical protein
LIVQPITLDFQFFISVDTVGLIYEIKSLFMRFEKWEVFLLVTFVKIMLCKTSLCIFYKVHVFNFLLDTLKMSKLRWDVNILFLFETKEADCEIKFVGVQILFRDFGQVSVDGVFLKVWAFSFDKL